jgi:hypothetical protein
VVDFRLQPPYLQERITVHLDEEDGWAEEPVWTSWRREKSLALTGIRTLDRTARRLVAMKFNCLLL